MYNIRDGSMYYTLSERVIIRDRIQFSVFKASKTHFEKLSWLSIDCLCNLYSNKDNVLRSVLVITHVYICCCVFYYVSGYNAVSMNEYAV